MADPRPGAPDPFNGSMQTEHGDPGSLAASIEKDFRALVALLAQQAERLGKDDHEALAHIARAAEAAERGLRLSERLVQMAESAQEQGETERQA